MFVDVNGDGIHDGRDTDAFWRNDSSTVDVYLVTNETYYGDPPYACPAPGLRGYTVNLYCSMSSVRFSNVRNMIPGMAEVFPAVTSSYGASVGYAGATTLPAGKYLLFRVTATPVPNSGCPDIEIDPTSCFAPPGVTTSFESDCPGSQGDDVLRYGEDWFDVGGVGGCTDFPGRVPKITCPAAVTGRELEPLSFPVSVFDPDCSIFDFWTAAVPSGSFFSGLSPIVSGVADGTFRWTPSRGQAGTYSVQFWSEDPPYGLPPFYKYWDVESTVVVILPEQIVHEARVFTTSSNRVTRLPHGRPSTCFQLEPVAGAFALEDVVPSSLRLHYSSETCGDHDIASTAAKVSRIEDADGNGVNELEACFGLEALSTLTPCLAPGTTQLPLEISGTLLNGDRVHGAVSQTFQRTGSALASIAPNPISPASAVEFTTTRRGFARVQVFDVQGRRVANTLEAAFLAPGYHRMPLAGAGTIARLASGVYFVRIVTQYDGAETHAVRIVR